MKQEIICEKCNGKNLKKDGVRETKNRGNVQKYKCKDCSHGFSIDDGFCVKLMTYELLLNYAETGDFTKADIDICYKITPSK